MAQQYKWIIKDGRRFRVPVTAPEPAIETPPPALTEVAKPKEAQEAIGRADAFQLREEPTIATAERPITSVGAEPSDFGGLSDEDKRVKLIIKQQEGSPLSQEEKEWEVRRVLKQYEPRGAEDIYGGVSEQYRSQLEGWETELGKRRGEMETERETALGKKREELEARYGRRETELRGAGARQREAAQTALSFSGFGRSTLAAERQADIQKNTEQQITANNRARELEMQMFKQELAGADAEALQGLQSNISQLKQQAQQFELDSAMKVAELNAENALKGEEALGNLMQTFNTATQSKVDKSTSELLGYVADEFGNPVLIGGEKMPLDTESGKKYQSQFNPITGEQIIFDPLTGESKVVGGKTANPDFPGMGIQADVKGYTVRDEKGSQCGEGTNDNTEGTYQGENIHFGNTYASKSRWIDPNITMDTVEAGNSLVIPMTTAGSLGTGHVAMITGVRGNKIFVDEFNRFGKEKLTSGSYSIDELNKYADQAGQAWGVAPTQFKGHIASGGQTISNKQQFFETLSDKGITYADRKKAESAWSTFQETGVLPKGKPLGGLEARSLADGQTAISMISPLREIVDEGRTAPTKVYAGVPFVGKYAEQTQKDKATMERSMQIIGKFMEGGKLIGADEAKYRRILPAVTDTPDVARNKMMGVYDMLMDKLTVDIESYEAAGFDTGEFNTILNVLQAEKTNFELQQAQPPALPATPTAPEELPANVIARSEVESSAAEYGMMANEYAKLLQDAGYTIQ